MPEADWIVLAVDKDGAFLIRYSDTGEFAGDTWTPNKELAIEVAEEEFGLREQDFIEVPDEVTDPVRSAAALKPDKVR